MKSVLSAIDHSGSEVEVNSLEKMFPRIRSERSNYLVNISKKWRYVYVETPKVACTSIKRMLQNLEVDEPFDAEHDVHDRAKSPLLSPLDSWQDFFNAQDDPIFVRFSFVRNPYTRILSCYLDKVVQNEFERNRLMPELGFSPNEIPSFRDFLRALRNQRFEDMDIHWLPQSVILQGLSKPSFLGRFENFSNDFSLVMKVISGKSDVEILHEAGHATGADRRIQQYIGEIERDLIVDLYESDFLDFCYSTDLRFT